eukprot:49345-Karenia_brevis.AAC.1
MLPAALPIVLPLQTGSGPLPLLQKTAAVLAAHLALRPKPLALGSSFAAAESGTATTIGQL